MPACVFVSGRLVGSITRTQTRLTSTEKLILVILGEHVRVEDGPALAFPSVETIATQAEVCTRTAKRALASLRAAGWIRVVAPGGRGGRRYSTTRYEVLPASSRGVTDVTPKNPRGDICGFLGVTLVSPDPVRDPEEQEKQTHTAAAASAASFAFDDPKTKTAKRQQPQDEPSRSFIRKIVHEVLARPDAPTNAPDVAADAHALLVVRGVVVAEDRVRAQVNAILEQPKPRPPKATPPRLAGLLGVANAPRRLTPSGARPRATAAARTAAAAIVDDRAIDEAIENDSVVKRYAEQRARERRERQQLDRRAAAG